MSQVQVGLKRTRKKIAPTSKGSYYVEIDGEQFCCITNSHDMVEFFMNVAGAFDHWMFVSNRGALTAGRQNSNHSLFPYYSADKISDMAHCTGPKTIVQVSPGDNDSDYGQVWFPFEITQRNAAATIQNLYKNQLGNKIVFEETNQDLQLQFRYMWRLSRRFGFVRSCKIRNLGNEPVNLRILDGFENLVPFGISEDFQLRFSNLADAYKKNELYQDDIGVFYLSSIPSDRAEPSEGLMATVCWQTGLKEPICLLSSNQLHAFLNGKAVHTEYDVRGTRGSYLNVFELSLGAGCSQQWNVIANINVDNAALSQISHLKNNANIEKEIEVDIAAGDQAMRQILSRTDAMQCGNNQAATVRHSSNAKYNAMRGGLPIEQYNLYAKHFCDFVRNSNTDLYQQHVDILEGLPDTLSIWQLHEEIKQVDDPQLIRLASQFLPFTFSRRHGDPSRPWNKFDIQLEEPDGSVKLHFQGNWRDVFQNWEALGLSYPYWLPNMVARFVNCSTIDGFNPYRIDSNGFEWESPNPDDPWANYGYWGDHQIVYLYRLLKLALDTVPGELDNWLTCERFSYANVPYRIKSYSEILRDPHQTIDYDFQLSNKLVVDSELNGQDVKLVRQDDQKPYLANLAEKLIVPILAKISSFVPAGGIWLNTQRPEWNDANNAMVGHGLSMVTVYHLYRYFELLVDWFNRVENESFKISEEVVVWFESVKSIVSTPIDLACDLQRKVFVDQMNVSSQKYRSVVYARGFSGKKTNINRTAFIEFFEKCRNALRLTIEHNTRKDGLYHSYNLMRWTDDGMHIEHLELMLEGQVAVLSANYLEPSQTVSLWNTLRNSSLYRDDVQSYLLYPDQKLPNFLQKNRISSSTLSEMPFLDTLVSHNQQTIVQKGTDGDFHFDGRFRNISDLNCAIDDARRNGLEAVISESQWDQLRALFVEHFQHDRFIGRSSTFFGYEGLGSVYWHMVSKLVLATQETLATLISATDNESTAIRLREFYRHSREGIGANKSPQNYGAFPSDPYSHQPKHSVVQQPGLTGQVKEDILVRFGELGIRFESGQLLFDPCLFETIELCTAPEQLEYIDISGLTRHVNVSPGEFAFTYCQVPIVYGFGESNKIEIIFADGKVELIQGNKLPRQQSTRLLRRDSGFSQIRFSSPVFAIGAH